MSRWMQAQEGMAERPVTSDPVSYDAPASAPASEAVDGEAQPADERVVLNEQMGKFLDQFSAAPGPAGPAKPPSRGDIPTTTQPATGGEWTAPARPRDTSPESPSAFPQIAVSGAGTGNEVVYSPRPPEPPASAVRVPRVVLLDIRPVAEPAVPAGLAEPSAAANQPAQAQPTAPPPDTLAGQIQALERSIAANPQHLDEQLRLRLLYLAMGQMERATAPFEGLDPVQGELLSALCGAVAAASEIIQRPGQASESAWLAVEQLHRLLGQQASVVIPKMVLVTRVTSFGDYQAITPPRLTAGQQVHVFLYTEVANFRSKPTEDGRVRTLLSQRVEVYDAGGKIIWQRTEPNIEDLTLSPRRDFFIPFPITMPANTPPGEYVLKATIEDKIGATTDQQRMTFTIVPP